MDDNLDSNLELVYENPGTKIYRVTASDIAIVTSLGFPN